MLETILTKEKITFKELKNKVFNLNILIEKNI